jgi:CRP/FNR family transcriptional regulator, cyclic AMP receptor protein
MLIDIVGYLAAGLVLATFCTRSMSRLRLIALVSNVAFITYGYLANLTPVLVLHTILLPVNTYRLWQLYWREVSTKVRERKAGRAPAVPGSAR